MTMLEAREEEAAWSEVEQRLKEKDATIKALADALEGLKARIRGFNHAESCQTDEDSEESLDGCDCPLQLLPQLDAALRLAGRLP